MDAMTELNLLKHHIAKVIPEAKFALLNLPKQPPEHTFWIDLLDETDTSPGWNVALIQRDWKMSYFHSQKSVVLQTLGKLRELFNNDTKLGFIVEGETVYSTMTSFSSGSIHESENDLQFSFSVLRTQSHGSRTREEAEKMQDIIIIAKPEPQPDPSSPDGPVPGLPGTVVEFPLPLPCRTLRTLRGGVIFETSIPLYSASYAKIGDDLIAGEADL